MPRSSSRWLLWLIREKRRNLYLLPSYESRLLALPYLSWTATKKPYACICNENIRHLIPLEIIADADYYISTGIYRCSTLDLDRNFARIPIRQESARINAFHYVCSPPSSPQPGLQCGLHCKVNHNCLIDKIIEPNFFAEFLAILSTGTPPGHDSCFGIP